MCFHAVYTPTPCGVPVWVHSNVPWGFALTPCIKLCCLDLIRTSTNVSGTFSFALVPRLPILSPSCIGEMRTVRHLTSSLESIFRKPNYRCIPTTESRYLSYYPLRPDLFGYSPNRQPVTQFAGFMGSQVMSSVIVEVCEYGGLQPSNLLWDTRRLDLTN